MDLTNASAIVTGGAGGFGSATVRRLAQKGAKVVIADVSDERGEALAREVGAGSLYVPTDCMDEDAIATAVKAAAGLGPLRAAVITHIGPDWPGGLTMRRTNSSESSTTLFANSSANGAGTRAWPIVDIGRMEASSFSSWSDAGS